MNDAWFYFRNTPTYVMHIVDIVKITCRFYCGFKKSDCKNKWNNLWKVQNSSSLSRTVQDVLAVKSLIKSADKEHTAIC